MKYAPGRHSTPPSSTSTSSQVIANPELEAAHILPFTAATWAGRGSRYAGVTKLYGPPEGVSEDYYLNGRLDGCAQYRAWIPVKSCGARSNVFLGEWPTEAYAATAVAIALLRYAPGLDVRLATPPGRGMSSSSLPPASSKRLCLAPVVTLTKDHNVGKVALAAHGDWAVPPLAGWAKSLQDLHVLFSKRTQIPSKSSMLVLKCNPEVDLVNLWVSIPQQVHGWERWASARGAWAGMILDRKELIHSGLKHAMPSTEGKKHAFLLAFPGGGCWGEVHSPEVRGSLHLSVPFQDFAVAARAAVGSGLKYEATDVTRMIPIIPQAEPVVPTRNLLELFYSGLQGKQPMILLTHPEHTSPEYDDMKDMLVLGRFAAPLEGASGGASMDGDCWIAVPTCDPSANAVMLTAAELHACLEYTATMLAGQSKQLAINMAEFAEQAMAKSDWLGESSSVSSCFDYTSDASATRQARLDGASLEVKVARRKPAFIAGVKRQRSSGEPAGSDSSDMSSSDDARSQASARESPRSARG